MIHRHGQSSVAHARPSTRNGSGRIFYGPTLVDREGTIYKTFRRKYQSAYIFSPGVVLLQEVVRVRVAVCLPGCFSGLFLDPSSGAGLSPHHLPSTSLFSSSLSVGYETTMSLLSALLLDYTYSRREPTPQVLLRS